MSHCHSEYKSPGLGTPAQVRNPYSTLRTLRRPQTPPNASATYQNTVDTATQMPRARGVLRDLYISDIDTVTTET